MTEEQFAKFLNDNGSRKFERRKDKYHYGTNKDFPPNLSIRLFVPNKPEVGVSFYSGVDLKKHSSLYGPWLATQLVNFFEKKDPTISVSVSPRTAPQKDGKSPLDEGATVLAYIPGIQFDEGDENDERIRGFGRNLLEFIKVTLGNKQTVKKSCDEYYKANQQFVDSYAKRRQASSAGLSDDELKSQEIQGGDAMTDVKNNQMSDLYWNGANKENAVKPRFSCNCIVFGAPGTGKSFTLNNEACRHKENGQDCPGKFESADGKDCRYERVTFYPTYSYSQFVGCYKPVMEGKAYGLKSGRRVDNAKPLSIEDLAQRLKQAYDAASNAEPGQTAATLLFAEQYVDALNAQGKNAAKRVVERAGLPLTAYTAWLSAGIRAATYKARLQATAATVESEIAYKYVPGPFLRVLVKALNRPEENWCLIIEEINRANAAAVFGDVFQLLDRGTSGVSEYFIAASEDVKKYLKDEITAKHGKEFLNVIKKDKSGNEVEDWDSCSLRIPDNMYIWATMNSADQGVFPMDTAFKRRWAFEYIGVDEGAKGNAKCLEWTIEGCGYNWNAVRLIINGLLTVNGVNEDKLLGPYFIHPATENTNTIAQDAFSSKVLMYLWEDAGRMIRRNLFGDKVNTYSKLVEKWKSVGIAVVENAVKLDDDTKHRIHELVPLKSSQDDPSKTESTAQPNS